MIWERCNGAAHIQPISGRAYRLVESQEQVATLGYVDNLDEQAVLEDLLEATKPANLPAAEPYHYLLKTPFRYPPLKWGSRYGQQHEPGIFYAGKSVTTTLAESAYYRFVFWYSIDAIPPTERMQSEHTLFSVRYRTDRGIQLQNPPFSEYSDQLCGTASYGATQTLGTDMREAGVDGFEYASARDPEQQPCVGLFHPSALAQRKPDHRNRWLCDLSATEVVFKNLDSGELHRYSLQTFCTNGKLPLPA